MYPVLGRRGPVDTDIYTFSDEDRQLPLLEAVFSGLDIQPRIRQVRIIVFDERRLPPFHFWLFFKNHRHLRQNMCLRPTQWKGDIVVMRAGASTSEEFLPMRDIDAEAADFAVEQYVLGIAISM